MVISKTPLRASFFGGGTDFKDFYECTEIGYGSTISTALNMYVYIMVNKRFDRKIRVSYRIQELVDRVDEIQHNIIREALRIARIDSGVDIVYSADIPISTSGVGLASSSAMAVGVLNALFAYKGIKLSAEQLAKYACEIEITRLKNPIGIQAQYAVASGGEVRNFMVICNPQIKKALQKRMMLFYTGMNRVSSDILGEQKQNISNRMTVLNEMVEMVEIAEQALIKGKLDEWGYMLDRVWNMKKQLSGKISNQQIDAMYEAGKAAGALGGKVLGAGGGGFLLLYVPEEKQDAVRRRLKEYRQVEFDFEDEGSRIIFIE